jgi:type IV pilus assembly protein PilW
MDTSIMSHKHLQGFTLTEIMVALAISSILMAGVLTIMSSSKRTYALQSELSDLQDSARFIMEELARHIRIAGYQGCRSDVTPKLAVDGTEIDLGAPFGTLLNGTSVNNRNIVDENGDPVSFPQSDALVITALSEPLQLQDNTLQLNSGATNIQFHSRSILPDSSDPLRNRLVISDCGGTEVYDVISVAANPVVITPPLKRDYLHPISVFLVASAIAYEVKSIGNGQFALFKCEDRDNDGICPEALAAGQLVEEREERLVEGVENMQVLYGIDTAPATRDGVPNQYDPTPNLGPNDKVVSVRISLLMRTNDKRGDLEGATDKTFHLAPDLTFAGNPGPYNPQQHNSALESGYRHRMFTTTIQVRN